VAGVAPTASTRVRIYTGQEIRLRAVVAHAAYTQGFEARVVRIAVVGRHTLRGSRVGRRIDHEGVGRRIDRAGVGRRPRVWRANDVVRIRKDRVGYDGTAVACGSPIKVVDRCRNAAPEERDNQVEAKISLHAAAFRLK